MSVYDEATVVLVSTKTPFEADTIAQALQARGIDARVLDAANAVTWSGAFGLAKVVVLESQERQARLELENIKAEVSQIDWESMDFGDEAEGARLTQAARSKRWVWTVVFLLVPLGLFTLAYGFDRGDRMIQLIAGTVLFSALALGWYAMFPEKDDPPATTKP